MKLLGIEMSLEEFDSLMVAQSNGKELKVINGRVIAVDHEITEEEIKQNRINEINNRLNALTQDFVQVSCGEIINDIEDRKKEFVALHQELRFLLGKEKRKTIYDNLLKIDINE